MYIIYVCVCDFGRPTLTAGGFSASSAARALALSRAERAERSAGRGV